MAMQPLFAATLMIAATWTLAVALASVSSAGAAPAGRLVPATGLAPGEGQGGRSAPRPVLPPQMLAL